jgi:iron uptake system EfeUOB component EfeO/EfeM
MQDKIDAAMQELNTTWASCRDYGGKVARRKMTEAQWHALWAAVENLGAVVGWAERVAGEKEGE